MTGSDGRVRLKVLDSRGREVDAWRMCFRKCRYPTRARAKRAARKHGLHVYRCPLCRQWHLIFAESIRNQRS